MGTIAGAQNILAALKGAGIDLVSSVPDINMLQLINLLYEDKEITHVPVGREEEGIGVCAGAHLGGKKPAMLMQTDGRQRAQVHPQRAVAVENEDFSFRHADRQAEADGRTEAEGFDLDIAVARSDRVPLGGGAAGRGNEQFVLDQRRDRLQAFESFHSTSRL